MTIRDPNTILAKNGTIGIMKEDFTTYKLPKKEDLEKLGGSVYANNL